MGPPGGGGPDCLKLGNAISDSEKCRKFIQESFLGRLSANV